MNIIQYLDEDDTIRVGIVENAREIRPLAPGKSVYDFAVEAIEAGTSLNELLTDNAGATLADYDHISAQHRLLSPVHHPDEAHLLVTGTGLTHLGSADARASMHAKLADGAGELTDSMKLFRMGIEGGKPSGTDPGVQPEWFYKGDGSILAAPGQPLGSPGFALDGGEEPEIAGVYLIGPDGSPFRLGFVLGNEFSDHKMEKINYLYLAHSKLRPCAIGPELALGALPPSIEGIARIRRDERTIWEKPFLSGEENMCHSIENLEAHHFKYAQFRRPGDVHVHFFGTATLSFSDNIEAQEGDVFEVAAPHFGRALSNPLTVLPDAEPSIQSLSS